MGEQSATRALLGTVCDVIVELDATLTIADEAPQLSHLLLRSGTSLQGEQLQAFMPDEDDRTAYTKAMLNTSVDIPARAFHTRIRDSDGNSLSMELFAVQFEGVDGLPQHLLGMREFTDLPPLAKLPDAHNAKVAAEAAAASIQRKQMHKAKKGMGNISSLGGCSNPISTGTPHETDWQNFQEHEPAVWSSSPTGLVSLWHRMHLVFVFCVPAFV